MCVCVCANRRPWLEGIGDLDYLTHIVFRMYECFNVPAIDPKRFRIEILLSTGVCLDPFKHNIIKEIGKAAAQASKKEKERPGRAVDKSKGSGGAGGIGGGDLPILRQFPIQNDHAHATTAGGTAVASPAATTVATGDPKAKSEDFLTLNDFESYLWKFRRKQDPQSQHGGHSSSHHSSHSEFYGAASKRASSPNAGRGGGGPKKKKDKESKKKKKKGSDSDSD